MRGAQGEVGKSRAGRRLGFNHSTGWAFFWGFPAVPPPLPLHQPPESPRRQAPRWSGSIGWSGVATYLGDLPVGHKGGQGLAHAPLLVRAQVLGGHLDAHLERKSKVDD